MWDEKVPRKSNATSSGSRQIPGGRLVGFALAWVLGEPGRVIAALEDLDSLMHPAAPVPREHVHVHVQEVLHVHVHVHVGPTCTCHVHVYAMRAHGTQKITTVAAGAQEPGAVIDRPSWAWRSAKNRE